MFTLITAIDTVKVFGTLDAALAYCTMAWDAAGFAPVICDIDGNWVEYHFNARNKAVAA